MWAVDKGVGDEVLGHTSDQFLLEWEHALKTCPLKVYRQPAVLIKH
jgi:hypothetical protein